ncbi:MAG: helix-turn-helix transcriptional regulator [Acidimicrobiales bacterium]
MGAVASSRNAGPLLRDWRLRRRRSQMDLALEVGVSPRHLSFVETGRSRPSPELLLALADHLDVPLRERNVFLLAAGYAPRYGQTPVDDGAMTRVRVGLQRMLAGHDPYPGIVIDRMWNAVIVNQAAGGLADLLPDELRGPPLNIFRASLHPDGLARYTVNLPEWAAYLMGQLRRLEVLSGDDAVSDLVREVATYPAVAALGGERPGSPGEPQLLVPWRVRLTDVELSFFTTLTTFGTPRDVTLDELAIELFYPADDRTEAYLTGG